MHESPLLRWFHRLFPRPVFNGKAQRTRLGAMVNDFFGVAILIGSLNLLITVPFGLYVSPLTVAITLAAVSLSFVALILVRRGWVFSVARFGTGMLILIGLAGLYTVGTVQALQMSAFFTAIVFATLTFGSTKGGLVTLLTSLIVLGFTLAESQGLLVKAATPSPWGQWILFITHGFLIFLLSALIRRHMSEAVGEEQKLTEQVRALLAEVTTAKEHAEDVGNRYRTVVDNVAESIAIVQDGKIVFCNPQLEKLLRSPLVKIIDQPFRYWTHPEDLHLLKEIESPVAANKENPQRIVLRICCTGGETVWVEFSGVAITWSGKPATLAFIRDITERRRLEESLERSLVNATDARRHAEAASNFKSSFLANISHEIRTPMNSIIGMSRLAERTELTPQQRDYLSKIRVSGDHLLQLIDSILDMSKIEMGKLELEHCAFALDTLLEQTRAMLQPRAEEKGLSFAIDCPPQIPNILRGDPLRLRQILINLCGNAIKFTERGSIRITIDQLTCDTDIVELQFSVIDTGIGISPSQQGRLFSNFAQANASISRQYGGTGLGLAISKQLVELMGGQISIESKPGQGSRFWFSILLERAPAEDVIVPAPPSSADMTAMRSGLSGIRILLADDNSFNRQVASELLMAEKIMVSTADNGAEAVSLALNQEFDCILMDVQMPILDGLAAARQIRATESGRRVPILAMTASTTDEDRQRCLAAGMDEFISKPISPERLLAVLSQVLNRSLPVHPGATPSPQPLSRFLPEGPLDQTSLLSLTDNNVQKALTIAMSFMENLRENIEACDKAMSDKDLSQIAMLAHRIRPASKWVGAGALAAEYDALQAAADSHDAGETTRRLEEIRSQHEAIRQQLVAATIQQPIST